MAGESSVDVNEFLRGPERLMSVIFFFTIYHYEALLGLARVGVMSSVAVRLSALTLRGEEVSIATTSGLKGGTFSLLESPSSRPVDVRTRFGFGVGSGVWSWGSHAESEAVDASCW